MEFVIENLTKTFGNKVVINDASFSFQEGKIYGLLGRNGAGKTTLFNCINGDLKTNGGRFFFFDGEERKPEASDIGYVLSTPNVPDFLTAREFLKFFLEINPSEALKKMEVWETPGQDGHASENLYQNLDSNKMDRLFDIVKLAPEDRDRLLKDFSHGMKNKMQMLVALISEPKLLLLDEPLTSLDVVVSEEMKNLLRSYKEGRVTIFSTHILDLAIDLCDEIVLLSKGRLEPVEHAQLNDQEFKAHIIESLQDEDNGDTVNIPQA